MILLRGKVFGRRLRTETWLIPFQENLGSCWLLKILLWCSSTFPPPLIFFQTSYLLEPAEYLLQPTNQPLASYSSFQIHYDTNHFHFLLEMITVKTILHTNKQTRMKPSAIFSLNSNSQATKHLSYHYLDYCIISSDCWKYTYFSLPTTKKKTTKFFLSAHSSYGRHDISAIGTLSVLRPLQSLQPVLRFPDMYLTGREDLLLTILKISWDPMILS